VRIKTKEHLTRAERAKRAQDLASLDALFEREAPFPGDLEDDEEDESDETL